MKGQVTGSIKTECLGEGSGPGVPVTIRTARDLSLPLGCTLHAGRWKMETHMGILRHVSQ